MTHSISRNDTSKRSFLPEMPKRQNQGKAGKIQNIVSKIKFSQQINNPQKKEYNSKKWKSPDGFGFFGVFVQFKVHNLLILPHHYINTL